MLKRHVFLMLLYALLFVLVREASAESDCYIKGYSEALVRAGLKTDQVTVAVRNGVVIFGMPHDKEYDMVGIISGLQGIDGVERIVITNNVSVEPGYSMSRDESSDKVPVHKNAGMLKAAADKRERLFDPLIADPRWPHFSIAYQYYFDDSELEHVGATSFGETLPFYRSTTLSGMIWQIGLQAAVFAMFDLDSDSSDLINADYWVGIPFSFRQQKLSALFRIFHQSSHLGDEYILRSRVDRVNLSYEAMDAKVSYDVSDRFRIYGGAGYILHKEPDDLKPLSVQYGAEFRSGKRYFGIFSPVAGADFKSREESDWNTDISLQTGFQFRSERILWNDLQLTLQYFNGHSPNGQFYERSIEYLSLGAHFYFQ